MQVTEIITGRNLCLFFIINYLFIFQYFLGSQHGQMYGCGRLYLPSTGKDEDFKRETSVSAHEKLIIKLERQWWTTIYLKPNPKISIRVVTPCISVNFSTENFAMLRSVFALSYFRDISAEALAWSQVSSLMEGKIS